MTLFDDVYSYYRQHFNELPQDKQFHFATRIGAWRGELWAYDVLRSHREPFTSDSLQAIIDAPRKAGGAISQLRTPFFQRYPRLFGLSKALFHVRHLEAVYGIDAREVLFAFAPRQELDELRDALLSDPDAVAILSTVAINYLYLLERVIYRSNDTLPLDWLYALRSRYDLSNMQHVQLLIYLYTHCIIGDTNFYTKQVPESALPVYQRMLRDLEGIITTHYDDIKLDNKLEFLVCTQICNIASPLAGRIYNECQASISPSGTFLVDTHNTNSQSKLTGLSSSEHRNVLFIMSGTPYAPHSTLIT